MMNTKPKPPEACFGDSNMKVKMNGRMRCHLGMEATHNSQEKEDPRRRNGKVRRRRPEVVSLLHPNERGRKERKVKM